MPRVLLAVALAMSALTLASQSPHLRSVEWEALLLKVMPPQTVVGWPIPY